MPFETHDVVMVTEEARLLPLDVLTDDAKK